MDGSKSADRKQRMEYLLYNRGFFIVGEIPVGIAITTQLSRKKGGHHSRAFSSLTRGSSVPPVTLCI